MTAITFNTLKFANRLKEAGVPARQAEAEAQALSEVFEANLGELATKGDLRELELRLAGDMKLLSGELKFLRWGMGILLAGVASLILKTFF